MSLTSPKDALFQLHLEGEARLANTSSRLERNIFLSKHFIWILTVLSQSFGFSSLHFKYVIPGNNYGIYHFYLLLSVAL